MEGISLSGYLFEKNVRLSNKYFPWFLFPSIGLFSVFLWFEAIKHTLDFSFLMFAILWSAFVVWIVWKHSRTHNIASIEYACTQNAVINKYKDNEHIAYLDNTLFLTLLPVDFVYGKGTQRKDFYIISNLPIHSDILGSIEGLLLFQKLFMQEMIAIPKNVSTQLWILETLGIDRIPEYPAVACLTKTGDGSLS